MEERKKREFYSICKKLIMYGDGTVKATTNISVETLIEFFPHVGEWWQDFFFDIVFYISRNSLLQRARDKKEELARLYELTPGWDHYAVRRTLEDFYRFDEETQDLLLDIAWSVRGCKSPITFTEKRKEEGSGVTFELYHLSEAYRICAKKEKVGEMEERIEEFKRCYRITSGLNPYEIEERVAAFEGADEKTQDYWLGVLRDNVRVVEEQMREKSVEAMSRLCR